MKEGDSRARWTCAAPRPRNDVGGWCPPGAFDAHHPAFAQPFNRNRATSVLSRPIQEPSESLVSAPGPHRHSLVKRAVSKDRCQNDPLARYAARNENFV